MTDSCCWRCLEAFEDGVLRGGYVDGTSDGDTLGDSEGTALIDGVQPVLRESESELPVAVPGRRLF